jgi:hypothetical protein
LACLGLLAACGSSGRSGGSPAREATAAGPCAGAAATRAQAVVAARAGLPAADVSRAPFVAPSGAPGCRFAARGAGGGAVMVAVSVDTSAQPYYRLEREVVEDSQVFSTAREYPIPLNVPGLGLAADWFGLPEKLEATDGRRLITVTATGPRREAARRSVSEAVAAAYLGRPG